MGKECLIAFWHVLHRLTMPSNVFCIKVLKRLAIFVHCFLTTVAENCSNSDLLWLRCIPNPSPRGVTSICRDTRMCHYFGYFLGGCSRISGYLFDYSRIFGYHYLVKFDFFQNNRDFRVLILIFPYMTLWNVACRALVSMILQFSFLFYYACAKSSILPITAASLSSYICSAF